MLEQIGLPIVFVTLTKTTEMRVVPALAHLLGNVDRQAACPQPASSYALLVSDIQICQQPLPTHV